MCPYWILFVLIKHEILCMWVCLPSPYNMYYVLLNSVMTRNIGVFYYKDVIFYFILFYFLNFSRENVLKIFSLFFFIAKCGKAIKYDQLKIFSRTIK